MKELKRLLLVYVKANLVVIGYVTFLFLVVIMDYWFFINLEKLFYKEQEILINRSQIFLDMLVIFLGAPDPQLFSELFIKMNKITGKELKIFIKPIYIAEILNNFIDLDTIKDLLARDELLTKDGGYITYMLAIVLKNTIYINHDFDTNLILAKCYIEFRPSKLNISMLTLMHEELSLNVKTIKIENIVINEIIKIYYEQNHDAIWTWEEYVKIWKSIKETGRLEILDTLTESKKKYPKIFENDNLNKILEDIKNFKEKTWNSEITLKKALKKILIKINTTLESSDKYSDFIKKPIPMSPIAQYLKGFIKWEK